MFIAGIPLDFFFFGLTLLGVALFHHHTLKVALTGLAVITLYKLGFADFSGTPGFAGLIQIVRSRVGHHRQFVGFAARFCAFGGPF